MSKRVLPTNPSHEDDDNALQRESDYLRQRVTELEHQQVILSNQLADCQDELHLFRSIVENIPDGIGLADLDGTITYTNASYRAMMRYQMSMVGMSLYDAYMEPPEGLNTIHDSAKSRGSWKGVIPYRRSDGTMFSGQLSSFVLRDQHGHVRAFMDTIRDVTEHLEMEDALQQAKEAAEQASQSKSEVVANMSHELRTPLNAIIGITGLLCDTDLTESQRGLAERVLTSGKTLLQIINDILDISKIEARRLDLEYKPFHLCHTIEETLDILAPKAAEKGLNLAYEVAEDVAVELIGDAMRLRQILSNLLSNAVKFTSEGEVIVRVTCGPTSVTTDNEREMQEIHVSVCDTGIGIPRHRIQNLFQYFYQGDSSMTRRYGGTGLGLAISKQLAEMMGGTIWVESDIGQGSTFHVTFQAEVVSPASPDPYRQETQPILAGKRMLIVEPHPTNQAIIERWCRQWQMQPVIVESDDAAPVVLESSEVVDVISLGSDLRYGMFPDAVALLDKLRLVVSQTKPPVILLWANIMQQSSMMNYLDTLPIETSDHIHLLTLPIRPATMYQVIIRALDEETRSDDRSVVASITAPTPVRRLAEQHPLTILLAEDNEVNQQISLWMLEKLGYRADVVINGLEVVRALRKRRYDVILMDMQMPEMDGAETTRYIQKFWPVGQRPWLIAMTAYAMQGTRERLLSQGFDDYIGKPVSDEDLAAALQRVPTTNHTDDSSSQVHPPSGSSTKPTTPPVLSEEILQQMQAEDSPLDATVFQGIVAMAGSARASGFFQLYCTNAEQLFTTMREALASKDIEMFTRAAHTLKSSSSQIGALNLSLTCKKLETMGEQGMLQNVEQHLQAAELAYAQVCNMLHTMFEIE